MHDPERDISDIPLSQLELSPRNVRKTPADASAFTELKASIAAHGLLENLIARSMGPSQDGPGRYAVIAGGRRLAAMQALAAEGALDEDHPVPCRMIGDIVAAEEVSLAENRADSIGRRNGFGFNSSKILVQGLGGCLPIQRLSRPHVKCQGDCLDFVCAVGAEVGSFREVLA